LEFPHRSMVRTDTYCPYCIHSLSYFYISIAMSVSVYLSAGISQNPYLQTSRNFLYVLPVAVVRSSSDDNGIRYVLPVLRMTSSLSIIGQAKATPIGGMLKVTQQGQHRRRSLISTTYIHTYIHRPTNLYSAKIVERI